MYILIIDTALPQATVALLHHHKLVAQATNNTQYSHAAWLHPAIVQVLVNGNISITQLNAVAVTNGPGSYTGLRIGFSAAKGLCYALQLPLITLNVLQLIAMANSNPLAQLYLPMMDARRDEVFTATYNHNFEIQNKPHTLLIGSTSFATYNTTGITVCCGNGAAKYEAVNKHANIIFSYNNYTAQLLSVSAFKKYEAQDFENITNAEPLYIKPVFITPLKRV